MTDETRKDYEDEKLEQTYVPDNSLMQEAENLVKSCDKLIEENNMEIEKLDKEL